MGGVCHRGLREGAEKLLADVKDDILQQLKQHTGYRLVLTGHSLGGGELVLTRPLSLEHTTERAGSGVERKAASKRPALRFWTCPTNVVPPVC